MPDYVESEIGGHIRHPEAFLLELGGDIVFGLRNRRLQIRAPSHSGR